MSKGELMAANRPVSFFQEELKRGDLSGDLVEEYLAEVEEILRGMEKGLAILQKMGKSPETKVRENQQAFLEVRKELLKRL